MKSALIILAYIAVVHASSSSSGSSVSSSSSVSFSSISSSVSSSYASFSIPSSILSTYASFSIPSSISVSILIPSSLVVPTVSSTLLSSISAVLSIASSDVPSISNYVEYDELLLASYPSVECAEKTLEQDIRSHAYTVSLIEDAISSPSTVTKATYVSDLEHAYPSIVTAYQQVFDVETSHSQFAYIQPLLTSLERVDQTLLTDVSVAEQASSPSTVEAEKVLYTVLVSSPSVASDLHTIAELVSHYPALSAAENLIAYYEKVLPSVVQSISEAVFSPEKVDLNLVAVYPTLASAELTISQFQKVVPAAYIKLISEAVSSPSLVPNNEKSDVKKFKSQYGALYKAERVVDSYRNVVPGVVYEIKTEIENPAALHAVSAIDNPQLAHACGVIDEYKEVLPSIVVSVSEEENSPQLIKAASAAAAKQAVFQHSALAQAEEVYGKYKKVNSAVVRKVSKEVSNSHQVHIEASEESHSSLFSAFKVVSHFAHEFPVLSHAQSAVDCAESHAAGLVQAYERVYAAKQSAKASCKHAAFIQKSMHKSFHHGTR